MKRLLVAVGIIVTLTAFAVGSPEVAAPVMGAAVISAPIASIDGGGCDIFCWNDEPAGCEEGWHDAFYLPEGQWHQYNALTNSGPHNDNQCYDRRCDDPETHGPPCMSFAAAGADLDGLRGSLAQGSVPRLRTMLKKHQAHFVLNIERSSIQILNCAGDAVAHLPIPRSMVSQLN